MTCTLCTSIYTYSMTWVQHERQYAKYCQPINSFNPENDPIKWVLFYTHLKDEEINLWLSNFLKQNKSYYIGEPRLNQKHRWLQSPKLLTTHLEDIFLNAEMFQMYYSIKIIEPINSSLGIRNKTSQIKVMFPKTFIIFSSLTGKAKYLPEFILSFPYVCLYVYYICMHPK